MKKIQFQLMCSVMHAADERPDRERERGDAGPDADRSAALPRRERGGDDRERRRVHQRRAEALDDARARSARSRSPARPQASDERGEDREADDEHPPAAEQVGELAAGEHERAEGERVAGDDPLELGDLQVSDRWIVGSATFTIVLSSMIMNRPNETAPSVHHLRCSRRRSWRGCGRASLKSNDGRVSRRVAEVVWRPDESTLERANIVRLMRRHGFATLSRARRTLDRGARVVLARGGRGHRTRVLRAVDAVVDLSRGPEWATWFVGGKLNVARELRAPLAGGPAGGGVPRRGRQAGGS